MATEKKIGIFSYGRTGSERVPNKMLRDFSNTTLVDILINKLSNFNDQSFFGGFEDVFREKCIKKMLNLLEGQKNLQRLMAQLPSVFLL
mgnify:CR=1 FL=1